MPGHTGPQGKLWGDQEAEDGSEGDAQARAFLGVSMGRASSFLPALGRGAVLSRPVPGSGWQQGKVGLM